MRLFLTQLLIHTFLKYDEKIFMFISLENQTGFKSFILNMMHFWNDIFNQDHWSSAHAHLVVCISTFLHYFCFGLVYEWVIALVHINTLEKHFTNHWASVWAGI